MGILTSLPSRRAARVPSLILRFNVGAEIRSIAHASAFVANVFSFISMFTLPYRSDNEDKMTFKKRKCELHFYIH
jgi:hypothetical protein